MANQPSIDNAAFLAALQAEYATFRQFYEILQTEQEALSSSDVDRLVNLSQLKSEKIIALTQMAEQRNRLLSAQSPTPHQVNMEQWFKQQTASNAIANASKIWRELLELAHSAQQLNSANGVMIETKLRHNQQALAVIQAASNQAALYGPDGKTQTAGWGRPLGKV